jgi:hypothetical protein
MQRSARRYLVLQLSDVTSVGQCRLLALADVQGLRNNVCLLG